METKLYVGNMSYSTTENELQTLFSEVGSVVTVDMIKDRMTGKAKGFAFVTMSSAEEAEKAISMFNGKEVDGRTLTVNIARPREERPRTGGGGDRRPYGGGGGGGQRGRSGGGQGNRGGGSGNRGGGYGNRGGGNDRY